MSSNFFPNIIETAPENLARLTFPNGIEIEPGKILVSDHIKSQPDVKWDADLNGLYTIFLLNSDTTSHQKNKNSNICHWMVINIPGNNVCEGKVLTEYNAPVITKDFGIQSFIFLIFKQADTITTDDFVFKITKQNRIIVKTSDYKTKFNIGNLVAGNCYKVSDVSLDALM